MKPPWVFQDGRLLLHDMRTLKAAHSMCLSSDGSAVGAVVFHPSTTHNLAAAVGATVQLLDLRSGSPEAVASCSSNSDDIASIDWHSSGRYLATADDAGECEEERVL
jgi:WD40 repeat protein